jgi:hypothetical protein
MSSGKRVPPAQTQPALSTPPLPISNLNFLTTTYVNPNIQDRLIIDYIMNPSSPSSPQSSPTPNQQASSTRSHRPSPRQTPSSGTPPGNTANAPIPDDEHGADLPMNMSASVMLTNLPRDAYQALADVERIDSGKGIYHLHGPFHVAGGS